MNKKRTIKCYTCGTMAREYFGNKAKEEWKPTKWKSNNNLNSICLWIRWIGYYSVDKKNSLSSSEWCTAYGVCMSCFIIFIFHIFSSSSRTILISITRWRPQNTTHIQFWTSHILHIRQCTRLRAPDPGFYTEYIKSKS